MSSDLDSFQLLLGVVADVVGCVAGSCGQCVHDGAVVGFGARGVVDALGDFEGKPRKSDMGAGLKRNGAGGPEKVGGVGQAVGRIEGLGGGKAGGGGNGAESDSGDELDSFAGVPARKAEVIGGLGLLIVCGRRGVVGNRLLAGQRFKNASVIWRMPLDARPEFGSAPSDGEGGHASPSAICGDGQEVKNLFAGVGERRGVKGASGYGQGGQDGNAKHGGACGGCFAG